MAGQVCVLCCVHVNNDLVLDVQSPFPPPPPPLLYCTASLVCVCVCLCVLAFRRQIRKLCLYSLRGQVASGSRNIDQANTLPSSLPFLLVPSSRALNRNTTEQQDNLTSTAMLLTKCRCIMWRGALYLYAHDARSNEGIPQQLL